MTPPRPDRPRRPARRLAALVAAVACLAAACSGGDAAAPEDAPEDAVTADDTEADLADRDDPLPVVTPTPRTMRWLGPDVPVPAQVAVRPSPGVDDATLAAVTEALTAAGATDVAVQDTEAAGDDAEADARPALTVLVGGVDDEPLAEALADARLEVPADLPAEGYALAAYGRSDGTGTIALAGADAAGTFYAAQTLRQLV
ncbi:MAG TPA: glycoside hydrolase family 20 zincin-like fold domain-containing protein, partial [Acidimicrobiales bacterium]|nr:glycoside hydrolase family 20 zincin-like fold domain-containing protein [Acidimicrobiales bacterium]